MTRLNNSKQYNEKDYYLVIDIETNTTYETFRNKTAAQRFIQGHPLKEILKLEINPKYKK